MEIAFREAIVEAIRQVYDPEIPTNVYDLGLIYNIDEIEPGKIHIDMTLTTPNCPAAQTLPQMVKESVLSLERVNEVEVEIVWDPPWTTDCLSEATKLELGLF
ncbi:MAG: system Fe-S cluster assembly protein [Francisellaceae bacterium]|nr:system Fe-S cluster assembly protein [Francisellaceae bacterium]